MEAEPVTLNDHSGLPGGLISFEEHAGSWDAIVNRSFRVRARGSFLVYVGQVKEGRTRESEETD